MREVGIIGYAQSPMVAEARGLNEVEMLIPVLGEALEEARLDMSDIDFICSGSCDYVAGGAFSFVMAVDSLGITPCKQESHVEMDAAWALYEAWLKFQCGEIDTALIYGFGKSSNGDWDAILSQQLDPYMLAPLWPDATALAGIQADLALRAGLVDERAMADVVTRGRANALNWPTALTLPPATSNALLAEKTCAAPLRPHDRAPLADGASVLILAAKDAAQDRSPHPAWIRGLDHRMEAHQLGQRDLTALVSVRQAADQLQLDVSTLDVAELFAPYTHQQLLLQQALGLDLQRTQINPSGGLQAGHIVMAGGLDRFGAAFRALKHGGAQRALAHAGSGPLLQHNLLGLLERDHG